MLHKHFYLIGLKYYFSLKINLPYLSALATKWNKKGRYTSSGMPYLSGVIYQHNVLKSYSPTWKFPSLVQYIIANRYLFCKIWSPLYNQPRQTTMNILPNAGQLFAYQMFVHKQSIRYFSIESLNISLITS